MCLWLLTAAAVWADGPSFDREVGPLLTRSCLECHGGADPEGGLDLSRADGLRRGGDSGPVIDAVDPQQSLLLTRVDSGEMPPEHPLPEADRDLLRRWIVGGAAWDGQPLDLFRVTTDKRAGYDWWSLQPLGHPRPPTGNDWCLNAIDRFIDVRRTEAGLAASPTADRRVLIRRLSYDLLGLPPTPAQIEEFQNDPRPDAYEQLVDRLLASPHYGSRWGRHWLDIARFGESQGFERDKLRENSWPYRDWVIDSLNADLPYDEFTRLQLAGDVLPDAGHRGVVATGFLVAGPWDEVGQNQQSAAMKAVVRQDELEDYVSTVGQTFLGLTLHCARCHDHKFDPVRQEEYYRLAAALDGVRHGSRGVISVQDQSRKEDVGKQIVSLTNEVRDLERRVRERVLAERGETSGAAAAPPPIARWVFEEDLRDTVEAIDGTVHGAARVADGALILPGGDAYVATAPIPVSIREKTLEAWVRLDSLEQRGGGVISLQTLDGVVFDAIVFGERDPKRWMAGSNGFVRTQSFSGPEETEAGSRFVHVAITYAADGTITGYRDGVSYGQPYRTDSPVTFEAGQARLLFGLRHVPAGGNRLLAGQITAAQLYDHALSAEEVAASAMRRPTGVTDAEMRASFTSVERSDWEALRVTLSDLQREHESLQPLSTYAVVPKEPGVSRVLLRGNPNSPADEVTPGGVRSLSGVESDFGLEVDASDAQRRRALSEWITSADNPLFARVIVNRLWHYHFGSGLVSTPSDFGFSGGRPSHPELLDWLAGEFQRSGMSLKTLHRLIVTSATYRQSSR
ncbi:MAG: DUF1549 domain-containing protein, partial [Planctomycetaceae bacterium]|nr:DUF1549 domain-containing protein [Planctomycetaceae bacterium]